MVWFMIQTLNQSVLDKTEVQLKYLNKSSFWFKPLIQKYFEQNHTKKLWISQSSDLPIFELIVYF